MPQSDPWTTFDRRILREGITIPPMLGPYLDQLRESGGEPPQVGYVIRTADGRAHSSGKNLSLRGFGFVYRTKGKAQKVLDSVQTISRTYWTSGGWDDTEEPNPLAVGAKVHAVLVIDCGDLGLTPSVEVVDG